MFCPRCGKQNEPGAKYCVQCGGSMISAAPLQQPGPSAAPGTAREPGRGGMILAFGILSLILVGPVLGIPAWVMGHKDMKKIRAGTIVLSQKGPTQSGMICGMIGTFISPGMMILAGIVVAVALSLFSAQAIQARKDAVIGELNVIAADACQYSMDSEMKNGGRMSYAGYKIPGNLAATANGRYTAEVLSSSRIKLTGRSSQNENDRIVVYVAENGRLHDWSYTGEFE